MEVAGCSETFTTVAQNTRPHGSKDRMFKINHTRSNIRMIFILYKI